jgi:hypothetical protein
MGVIDKGHTFVSGENVTADKLNNLADDAIFNSNSTDGTTLEVANPGGYIKVKDAGIDTQHLADDAVTTAKIADDNVTYDKIQNVAANSVIGNPTASDATPQAISIADLSADVATDIGNATTSTNGLMSSADKTKLDGLTNTTYSAGAGLNLTGTTFALDSTVPAGAVDFDPGSDFIQNSYTDAQRTSEGFPTDGGVLAKSRPSSATDDGNIWFMCNRSDNTSYGRVNVVNTSPNAKGAIFQAVAFRPTATALAGTPSNTSDSEFYVSASCQVQTLSTNFTGYNPRLALTFQNYDTSDVSNIFINAGAVYGAIASGGGLNLGQASNLWSEVFAANGTINTSDERLKQDIEDLSEAETRVAIAAKGLLKKFRWKEAVQQKGENARIHFGVIAQDLIAAFQSEGLDPFKYSVICFNEWWRNPEDPTDCRDEEVEGWEYGSQYAVRYDELLAFIIAAL